MVPPNHQKKSRIAVFASGRGKNAEILFQSFHKDSSIVVAQLFCNNPKAEVLERANKYSVSSQIISTTNFYDDDVVLQQLQQLKITHIVLAGFLWLVPKSLIDSYRNKIINIHPSLLPRFGGKGMFGRNVHRAVKESGAKNSGITIHLVNEKYDNGKILLQISCDIDSNDSIDMIESKITNLEHEYYHRVIREWIEGGLDHR